MKYGSQMDLRNLNRPVKFSPIEGRGYGLVDVIDRASQGFDLIRLVLLATR